MSDNLGVAGVYITSNRSIGSFNVKDGVKGRLLSLSLADHVD